MRLFQSQHITPLGDLISISTLNGLCLLTFQEEQDFIQPFLEKMSKHYQNIELSQDASQPILKQTASWLECYFEGGIGNSAIPPLDLIGTDFTKSVWETMLLVPKSELRSYSWIAEKIQKPKAVRAVGGAVGANPMALIIPCHRIIGANGALTGFRSGLWRKEWLLKHEGALYKH